MPKSEKRRESIENARREQYAARKARIPGERINRYTCRECGRSITTVDRDEGVTPFTLHCRASDGCDGIMYSWMYKVHEPFEPEFEWYKPKGKVPRRFREHVKSGGLLLRKIEESESEA